MQDIGKGYGVEVQAAEIEKQQEQPATFINYRDINSVKASLTNETVRAKLSEQDEADAIRLEMEGERVRSQYGDISDLDVLKVLQVEKEKQECKNCKGLPCFKKQHPLYVPKLVKDEARNRLFIDYAEKCGYEKMRLLNQRYGLAKIPPEYIGMTFENYKVDKNNEDAVKAAKALIAVPNKGAYFYGGVGTGKTLLAAIMAQEYLKRGREVVFATVPTISMQLRSTFKNNNSAITESTILEKLYRVPTLILDDIGMEKPTRFVCSTISNIFNERYNARLQTFITSNYTQEQVENIFNNPTDSREKTLDGTRIIDRCKQMCFPIELKGKSRR